MPKLISDDIIAPKKPRRLPVLSGRDNSRKKSINIPPPPPIRNFRRSELSPERKRSYILLVLACATFLFLLYSLSLFFVGATISIYPKQSTVSINKSFPISKNGGTPIHFETLELSAKESVESQATGLSEIKKKATGIIIVYNSYSSKTQKLIKNTRFETPDGKIFRINNSITVPGTSVVGGKVILGSIETTVSADEPGEEYNIGRTDFTIPGFKGDPKYEKFYARSKTDMKGGMIGNVYTISDEDAKTAKDTLEKRLRETLKKEAMKNTPEGFVLYDQAEFFNFDEINTVGKEGDKVVTVEETAKIYAIILRRNDLAKYIAQISVPSFDGSSVTSPNVENLNFSINNKDSVDYQNMNNVEITISGDTKIVWLFDQEALLSDLRNKAKKDFQSILAKQVGIERAELVITPFWARTFPDDVNRITVKTVIK